MKADLLKKNGRINGIRPFFELKLMRLSFRIVVYILKVESLGTRTDMLIQCLKRLGAMFSYISVGEAGKLIVNSRFTCFYKIDRI